MSEIKESAGRYFASFVVETDPEEDLPPVTAQVGIGPGLGHFAVLSDGRKNDIPRFLCRDAYRQHEYEDPECRAGSARSCTGGRGRMPKGR